MIHYVVGGTMITMIGSNLLNTIISSTVNILYSSANFVKNGTEANKIIKDIRDQIDVLDIPIKLKLVQTLLNQIENKHKKLTDTSATATTTTTESNDAISDILKDGLLELVYKIKSIIEHIDFEINKHNQKWFASYRSISINDNIKELENLIKILDGRIKLLLAH